MANEHTSSTSKKSLAIVALILNLVLPGLGSVIAGKTENGIKQLLLVGIAGLLTALDLIALAVAVMAAAAWIWALLTSIELLQKAYKK